MESQSNRLGLNGLNFFIAAVQTGFGPFISVWLIRQGWNQTDIGLALSTGTFVALLGQLPGGWLVDAVHRKRGAIAVTLIAVALSSLMMAVTLIAVALSSLMIAWLPERGPVCLAQALHALASCIITPAIAAITLQACGHSAYSERLGVNGRYASLGSAAAAGLLGLCAYYLSEQAVLVTTALLVLPALVALYAIRRDDRTEDGDHAAVLHPHERRQRHPSRPWDIVREPGLLVFALCTVLFHLANAAMLPLSLNTLAQRMPATGLIISASILLPQLVAAAISPRVGALAQRLGRKPVLLCGFAVVPLRGLLLAAIFALHTGGVPLVAVQVLDGVSAAVFGLMVPLVAADLTQRNGYLNLAIRLLGLAAGVGATVSTTLAGWLADTAGAPVALLGLAVAGGAATLAVALAMPETRPRQAVARAPRAGRRTGREAQP